MMRVCNISKGVIQPKSMAELLSPQNIYCKSLLTNSPASISSYTFLIMIENDLSLAKGGYIIHNTYTDTPS